MEINCDYNATFDSKNRDIIVLSGDGASETTALFNQTISCNKLTRMMKMEKNQDFNQAQNTQNKDEETMLRDFIRQEIGEHFQQQAMVSSASDAFYRQQSYITTLCHVQSIGHNVHEELTEAIVKLKELTYA